MKRLWNDESGAILSAELVLLMTILVIGMVAGLATVRDAVVQELGDIAQAIGLIDQSYSFTGTSGCNSSTAGAQFADAADTCDGPSTQTTNEVLVNVAPRSENH